MSAKRKDILKIFKNNKFSVQKLTMTTLHVNTNDKYGSDIL
jgi:hypothetical protein